MEKSIIWAVGSVVALSGLALAVAHRFTIEAHASMPTPFALNSALDRAEVTLADGRALSLHNGALSLAGRPIALSAPRRFASLTVMPTGQVLVWGGIDDEGRLIETGEWFEPSTGALVTTGRLGLPPRAGHTLNVLSDGTLAMTGGWGVGNVPAHDVALWRPLDRHLDLLAGDTAHVRLKSEASLLADGTLQITGGIDEIGRPVHEAWRFGRADSVATSKPHGVAASYPTRDNGGASPIGPLALRFSEPVDVAQLGGTVSLLGPNGVVKTRVVGAEDGRLAFVQLPDELYPAARYTIFVQGLHTAKGDAVPYEAIGFTTKAARSGVVLAGEGQRPGTKAPESSEPPIFVMAGAGKAVPCKPADAFHLCRDKGQVKDGAFYPGQDNVATSSGGHWRLYKDRQTLPDTKQLEANLPKGSTALIGQVRRIDESPVANVEISVDGQKVRTDGQGVFVLQHLLAGRRELLVDGRPAGSANTEYGRFIVGADVTASTVNHMPFVMYLPRVLERDKIALPSPTTRETVLTHPDMPGLELRIPAGAVFKDRDGKVLNEIAIVPTPVDHAPFPLPDNFPMYFTIQPGDAVVQGMTPEAAKGIQVVYPNYGKQKPADKADFWVYSAEKGWEMYGAGHVSADASQLVADKDTRLVWALGAGASTNPPEPDNDKKPDSPCSGDPVDLQTGLFVRRWSDLSVNDVMPISIDRTANSVPNVLSPFGYGAGTSLAMTLSSTDGFQSPKLVLSCGESIQFDLVSGQAVWPLVGTVWQHTHSRSGFYGATLQFLNDTTPEGAHWIVTLKDGSQYWFDRHAPNKLARRVDRFGNTVRYTYNAGLLTQITSPNGRSIQLSYNSHNLIDVVSDQTGRSVHYGYHLVGGPRDVNAWILDTVTFPDGTFEAYTYEKAKDGDVSYELASMKSVRDRRGNIQVTNTFEDEDRGSPVVAKQVYADGSVMAFAYERGTDGLVTATTVTDQVGSKVRTEFDPVSKYPSAVVRGYGSDQEQETTYSRNSAGLLLSTTDPAGRRTDYSYDGLGNVTRITNLAGTPNASSIAYTITPDSQISSITSPLGNVTTLTYDRGCVSSVIDATARMQTGTCNSMGQITSLTDASGRVTGYRYAGGDLVAITDPAGHEIRYVYDALGRPTSRIEAGGAVGTRAYDLSGRLTKRTDWMGSSTSYEYDGNGNVTSLTLPNGAVIGYTYDEMNRLRSRTDALGRVESWTYSGVGKPLTYSDRKGQVTTYSYDTLGRLDLLTYADGTGSRPSYDASNRITQIVDTDVGELSWTYDDMGRKLSEMSSSGTVTYEYDADGRRTDMRVGADDNIHYTYDGVGRPLTISSAGDVASISYDPAGRRSKLSFSNGVSADYGYDSVGQLLRLTYADESGSELSHSVYTYDVDGHRVTAGNGGGSLPDASVSDNSYDLANQLKDSAKGAVAYDANGNLTRLDSRRYVWNARNQLVEVKEGETTVLSFSYDPLGRRATKSTSGAVPTRYQYDGIDVARTSGGNGSRSYVNGPFVDEHLWARGATSDFFLADGLNSTVGLADPGGALIGRLNYGEYGSTTGQASVQERFLYTGREMDDDDLYYYRFRYYEPSLGRFISEDPTRLAAGPNSYGYVLQDPINNIDPLGLWTLQIGFQVSYSVTFFGVGVSGTLGMGAAIDGHGNVAAFSYDGLGGALGTPGASAGVQTAVSDGDTICDLGGKFNNASLGGGWGPDATGDAFWGPGEHGQPVVGAGVTIGAGIGASGSVGQTDTTLGDVGHLW